MYTTTLFVMHESFKTALRRLSTPCYGRQLLPTWSRHKPEILRVAPWQLNFEGVTELLGNDRHCYSPPGHGVQYLRVPLSLVRGTCT